MQSFVRGDACRAGFRPAPAMLRHYLIIGLICLFGLFISSSTFAQEAAEVPQALGPEAMQALVSKLDEEQTAALVQLIEMLGDGADRAEAETLYDGQSPLEIMQQWIAGFNASLARNISSLPDMISSLGQAIAVVFRGDDSGGSAMLLLWFAIAMAAGFAAEWLFKRATRAIRERIRESQPEGLMETLGILSKRAAIEIGGVIVFTLVAIITTELFVQSAHNHFMISTFILTAILLTRITGALMHFVLAPKRPELRLVYTDTWNARLLDRHFVLIAAATGTGFFIGEVMQAFSITQLEAFRFWLGLIIHLWLIFIILRAHRGLTQIIEGGEENLTPGLKIMAVWWPIVSAAFVAFNWLFLRFVLSTGHEELTPERSAAAIACIVMVPFLDTIVRGVASHLVPSGEDSGEIAANAYEETRQSYLRIGRVVLLGIIIITVGKLWGVSLHNIAEAGFGAQVAANAVGFLLILALGYIAWEVTNLVINKRLAQEVPAEGSGEAEGGAGGSRMATVLPILQVTLQVSIIIITVLLALSQLGLNITPLLAGAGVLGLAIGFGAQTLVKDIVSGVFFLLDDAFRVGEFITVGSTGGLVARIAVRSLHLRQDTGQLHIIPYGSMSQLTNNSRDWVTMKLRFTVPFDTDQDKVRKLFKKIGQEMMEVPELAEVLINPFKSQGAAEVTDVGIVIRGKFSTVPGGQFLIRKEVYNRVAKAFEANGIEFARKEVRVHLPESVQPSELSEEQKQAVSAAVSDEDQAPAKPASPADDR